MAARARSKVVLRACAGSRAKPGRREVPGEDAVLWRRRSGHGFGSRLRHQLSRSSRCSAFEHAHARSPGRGDRPSQRSISFRKKGCIEGRRCARGRQHRSCGKRTAFPAVMHTLSTEIHQRKSQCVLALTIFLLFHLDFHSYLRLPFPLPTNLRDPYLQIH